MKLLWCTHSNTFYGCLLVLSYDRHTEVVSVPELFICSIHLEFVVKTSLFFSSSVERVRVDMYVGNVGAIFGGHCGLLCRLQCLLSSGVVLTKCMRLSLCLALPLAIATPWNGVQQEFDL